MQPDQVGGRARAGCILGMHLLCVSDILAQEFVQKAILEVEV